MSKSKIMKLTVPGKAGYVPSIDTPDPVSGSSTVETTEDVTSWLLTKLADIHSRASQIITDHLASIRPPEAGGVGYSTAVKAPRSRFTGFG
jgi:hypothetical protein